MTGGSTADPPERAGIVLAGGRSTRFGRADKALAKVEDTPLVRRVADRVVPVVDELVVNCRAEQVSGIRRALDGAGVEPRLAIDDPPDRGPVAGLATALRVASAPEAVALACDMPTLDAGFLDALFDAAAGHDGAVPTFEGRPQPLCAVYGVAPATEACHAALREGGASLRAVLDRLDSRVLPEDEVRERTDAATFRNVNSRQELREVTQVESG